MDLILKFKNSESVQLQIFLKPCCILTFYFVRTEEFQYQL